MCEIFEDVLMKFYYFLTKKILNQVYLTKFDMHIDITSLKTNEITLFYPKNFTVSIIMQVNLDTRLVIGRYFVYV